MRRRRGGWGRGGWRRWRGGSGGGGGGGGRGGGGRGGRWRAGGAGAPRRGLAPPHRVVPLPHPPRSRVQPVQPPGPSEVVPRTLAEAVALIGRVELQARAARYEAGRVMAHVEKSGLWNEKFD